MTESPAATVVKVRRLRPAEDHDVPLPVYQTPSSAGLDLHAAVTGDVVLAPGERALVPTGLALELPPGYEGQVRPRSGLALRHGVTLLNSPGTIDADYRGELSVILINHGERPFLVQRGDRVAQLVIAPVTRAAIVAADDLSATRRGSGGFGHTGV